MFGHHPEKSIRSVVNFPLRSFVDLDHSFVEGAGERLRSGIRILFSLFDHGWHLRGRFLIIGLPHATVYGLSCHRSVLPSHERRRYRRVRAGGVGRIFSRVDVSCRRLRLRVDHRLAHRFSDQAQQLLSPLDEESVEVGGA